MIFCIGLRKLAILLYGFHLMFTFACVSCWGVHPGSPEFASWCLRISCCVMNNSVAWVSPSPWCSWERQKILGSAVLAKRVHVLRYRFSGGCRSFCTKECGISEIRNCHHIFAIATWWSIHILPWASRRRSSMHSNIVLNFSRCKNVFGFFLETFSGVSSNGRLMKSENWP